MGTVADGFRMSSGFGCIRAGKRRQTMRRALLSPHSRLQPKWSSFISPNSCHFDDVCPHVLYTPSPSHSFVAVNNGGDTGDMSGSCENYGTPNGTACACPPGFGGSTCSQPACGGTIFQGSGRSLANGSPFANLTSSGCSCEDGWTGTGCNVCQTAKACQSGFASVRGSAGSLTGTDTGQNNTIVCSAAPRVYAAGEMSCAVQVSLTSSVDLQLHRARRCHFAITGARYACAYTEDFVVVWDFVVYHVVRWSHAWTVIPMSLLLTG